MMRCGEAATIRNPPASSKGPTAHETRCPDVTVDATLVTEPVGKACLAKQFVKLVLVRPGNQGANLSNASIDARGGLSLSRDGDADGAEERVRQLKRRGLSD